MIKAEDMTMRVYVPPIKFKEWVVQEDSIVIHSLDDVKETYELRDVLSPERFKELMREEEEE